MALPPAQGVTKAVLNLSSQGIATANVLHFTSPPGPNAPDPTALGTRLAAWWENQIAPQVHTSQVLNSVICTDLSAGGPPSVEVTTGLPAAGSMGGEPLPNSVAGVVSLHTALRGRSFRGRIYHGGFAEVDVNGNNIGSLRRNALLNAYELLILFTEPLLPDYQLVVLSYFANGAQRPVPVATPVTAMSMNLRVDTQRRRLF